MKTVETFLEKLNLYQKIAVTDESPVTLVNASVGSGKTTVLITKVLYLHFCKGVDFKDMFILTFTNKAAAEIKKRITAADETVTDSDMPYFGTFHSVALKMLKTILPVADCGYTPDFTVIDPNELQEMALDLCVEKGFKIKYKNKLAKRLEILAAGKTISGPLKYDDAIEALWDAVCQEKKNQNKMDFNDLMKNATELLEQGISGQSVLSPWSYEPKWIIIDEFQDCDESQLAFIKALKTETTKLFAVGDRNQIIYTWRGSLKNIFSEFQNEYDARILTLPVNYRSSTTILEAAKCFLPDGSVLEGTRGAGNPITLHKHYDPFNEANYLADKVRELHDGGVCYREIAVFYRTQKQSQVLENVFQREEIPFEVSVRRTFADIPVLRWYVKLLKASLNENDTGNLAAVLRDKTFGEGLTKSKITKIITEKGNTSSCLARKIRSFESWCLQQTPPYRDVDLYAYFDLDSNLLPTSTSFAENKAYVLALNDNLLESCLYQGCTLLEGVKEFINSSALYGADSLKENINIPEDSVKMMTLHACKGLEFKYVFIIGVNDGLIPLNTDSAEEQDEEKRLFFVGITRAIDNLEISFYTSHGSQRVLPGKCSYLYLFPPNLIAGSDNKKTKNDLQAFRREVKSNMEITHMLGKNADDDDNADEKDNDTDDGRINEKGTKITVRHDRYGSGTIESEDEKMVTVLFEGYGLKEFAKGFNALVYL